MGTLGSLTSVGGRLDTGYIEVGRGRGEGGGAGRVCGQPSAFPVVSALPLALPLSVCALIRPSSVALIHTSSELRERVVGICYLTGDYWRLLTSTSISCTLLKIGMQGNVITVTTSVVPAYNME